MVDNQRHRGGTRRDTLKVAISWYLPLNRNMSTEICDLEQSIANVL